MGEAVGLAKDGLIQVAGLKMWECGGIEGRNEMFLIQLIVRLMLVGIGERGREFRPTLNIKDMYH